MPSTHTSTPAGHDGRVPRGGSADGEQASHLCPLASFIVFIRLCKSLYMPPPACPGSLCGARVTPVNMQVAAALRRAGHT
eukprot:350447-Chlamydomonas_euryale.AAC.4